MSRSGVLRAARMTARTLAGGPTRHSQYETQSGPQPVSYAHSQGSVNLPDVATGMRESRRDWPRTNRATVNDAPPATWVRVVSCLRGIRQILSCQRIPASAACLLTCRSGKCAPETSAPVSPLRGRPLRWQTVDGAAATSLLRVRSLCGARRASQRLGYRESRVAGPLGSAGG